jgi:tetratricopeptide (TPR) repeat protein
MKCFNDALKILLQSELSFLLEISAIYNNIGGVEYSKGNYDSAIKNFSLAMVTLSKSNSSHPWLQDYTDNYKAAQRQIDRTKPKRLRVE